MKALSQTLIRIMAIYFFVNSLYYIESLISAIYYTFSSAGGSTASIINWSYLLIPIIMICTSIILWSCATRISNLVVRGTDEDINTKLDFSILLNLSIIIAGIVLAANSIPNLISGIYSFHINKDITNQITVTKDISGIISSCIRIMIGVWLVFGFKGIGSIIMKLGRAGVYSLQDDQNKNE